MVPALADLVVGASCAAGLVLLGRGLLVWLVRADPDNWS